MQHDDCLYSKESLLRKLEPEKHFLGAIQTVMNEL